MTALKQIEARAHQIDRQWHLRIERAQYEADLVRRRFFAVDPENRLVARSLERDWNEKLAEIERLGHEYATLPKPTARLASPEERQRILALAQDLPAVWHASTTMHVERKQLLRFLVKDVMLTKRETAIHIGIRWQTDALTELDIPRPQRPCEKYRTNLTVIDRIRELAPTHTDHQIAEILNREGFTSGKGASFSRSKVQWVRYRYDIPTGHPIAPNACSGSYRGDGRCSTIVAAELLNVSRAAIAHWCQSGRLDAIQEAPLSPWWIKLTPETITELRKPARRRQSRRSPK